MEAAEAVDVHQHLWPEQLVDRLRARTRAPYLRGWTLHTTGEAPFEIDPAHHDVQRRVAADHEEGVGLACVSLSAPIGVENLVRPEAGALIDAWHEGARSLPGHFRAWASVPMVDPDLDELTTLLREGFVGVQLPATDLLSPAAWERAGDVLRVAELADKPVLVHPGPELRRPLSGGLPQWWAPVVGYVTQLQAAWWGWHAAQGRALFPRLRVVFAAGAGLAPVHHERHVTRGGEAPVIDPQIYVDTSSYGPQALDALVRVLGIDVLTLGSDRPYASPIDRLLGDAATHAVRVVNPNRVLGRSVPTTEEVSGTWARAS
jgi:predicted TIM-barrel fold metal-dependent hydrolase